MFAGGYKKDDGLPTVSTANIFSALESRRRKSSKKKSDKDVEQKPIQEPQAWVPPVTVKSWADVEDDDDYFAAPPSVWGQPEAVESKTDNVILEESEDEDEVDEEAEEELEGEKDETLKQAPQDVEPPQTPVVNREPDKQLSKKELKKKELAELDAVLAEFGLAAAEAPTGEDQHEHDASLDLEKKASKKKKSKKEKPSGKDNSDAHVIMEEIKSNVTTIGDPKEVLMKKLATNKKKKAMKENSGATSKVVAEAAARAAKIAAAAKKKEKIHYNQQPASR